MGLILRIFHYGDQKYLWSNFLMLLPLLFISCGVQKTNPYELNYQELHPVNTTADQDNKKNKYRPEVMAFKNGSLCINEPPSPCPCPLPVHAPPGPGSGRHWEPGTFWPIFSEKISIGHNSSNVWSFRPRVF